jgi:hypothetical protein
MLITRLEVIVYPQPGYRWHEELMDDPNWPEIEAAIRRLDRHEYPFLHLYLAPGKGSVVRHLNIIGGKGEYGLTGFDDSDHERFRFRDLSRSNGPDRIEIWTSDQGAAFQETYLCNDLAVVLKVVKHFAETGNLDASVIWEERGANDIKQM